MMWKIIDSYPKYSVSSEGQVRRTNTGRILKPAKDLDGYLTVSLCKEIDGKNIVRTMRVHKLVANAFLITPFTSGLQVNHKDGNKNNCDISNFEYLTLQENKAHAKELGLVARGSVNGNSKLKEDDVLNIRCSYSTGSYSLRSLASSYGVAFSTIGRIVNKEIWAHI